MMDNVQNGYISDMLKYAEQIKKYNKLMENKDG